MTTTHATSRRVAADVVGEIVLTYEFHKEGREWVGGRRELGAAADGPTLERVQRTLGRLALLHLNGLDSIGERERVFKERGITVYENGVPTTVDRPLTTGKNAPLVRSVNIRLPAPKKPPVAA